MEVSKTAFFIPFPVKFPLIDMYALKFLLYYDKIIYGDGGVICLHTVYERMLFHHALQE